MRAFVLVYGGACGKRREVQSDAPAGRAERSITRSGDRLHDALETPTVVGRSCQEPHGPNVSDDQPRGHVVELRA